MRNTIADLIYKKTEENKDLYLISGDAGLGVWDNYKVQYKSQFLNPGVNEACDVGMAAGMALRGHKVIYYNIAPFVIMRPYEQVRNDICYQELPVILIGTGSGVTYAPAGMTHYVVEDITLAKTMPNLDIFSPADPVEAELCFLYAYNSKNPSYIRIPKAGEPKIHERNDIDITKPVLVKSGGRATIITHSSMIEEVLKVYEELRSNGIDISVVTVPMITGNFSELDSFSGDLFVVEEHFISGGLGSIVKEYMSNIQSDKKVHTLGIKNEYIHTIGDRNYLRKHYGIDSNSIKEYVMEQI